MQDCHTVKAVEWAAEHHTAGSAPGTVLGTKTGRTLSHQAHESVISPSLPDLKFFFSRKSF